MSGRESLFSARFAVLGDPHEMLEAVGPNTDEGLPPRVARDELQRRADDIYAADRAEEFNRGEWS